MISQAEYEHIFIFNVVRGKCFVVRQHNAVVRERHTRERHRAADLPNDMITEGGDGVGDGNFGNGDDATVELELGFAGVVGELNLHGNGVLNKTIG